MKKILMFVFSAIALCSFAAPPCNKNQSEFSIQPFYLTLYVSGKYN